MVRIFNSIVQHLSLLCCVILCSFCKRTEVGTSWLLTIQAKAGIHAHGLGGAAGLQNFCTDLHMV